VKVHRKRSAYLSPEVQACRRTARPTSHPLRVDLRFARAVREKRAGEISSDVPPWLDELIEHCIEKNITKRYRTAEEVSAALRKLKSAAPE
jgi:hypothetical protein